MDNRLTRRANTASARVSRGQRRASSSLPSFVSPRGERGTRHRRERGQNLIEFALLKPLVLVFIAAIVIFGLALHARSSVQQATREGARMASVGASLSQVQNTAAGNANEWINPADVRWCHPLDSDGTRGQVGDPVRVYIHKGGQEGFPFTLVPSNGVFAAFGASSVTIRMSPRATSRLEKAVVSGSVVNC
jgi:hypothetical protein